ncbi:MAG: MarC family protein [Amaricoccus sp.]
METTFAIRFFGALFAIMNPLVTLPIFLSLTHELGLAGQRRTAVLVTGYAAVMCAVISFAGMQILAFFGVSIDDFRIAGGLVLAGIALSMLNGGGNPAHEGSPTEKAQQADVDGVAFYPLTFPMVVGPGTITTLVVFAQEARTPANFIAFAVIIAVMLALLLAVLWYAAAIGTHLSKTLRVIMQRLMGMILLAIAVGMLMDGVRALLPGLR